jgi:hypothetical protein
MKNISKLLAGILFSALVIAPSQAGELAVSGGATATYATNGDDSSAGKNLGISNEIDFTASGELDNGFTWKYQVQLDGVSTANDDTRLELGTDMGTIGFYVSEGGMSAELHGVGAMGPGFDYISPTTFTTGYDVDGYSNIQYHTPSGLLPLGLTAKIGYVPNMSATTALSAKESDTTIVSEAVGRNLTQLQVAASPVDGLSIKGDVAQTSNETGTSGSGGTEEGISANIHAAYTMGPVSVGYVHGGAQPALASGATVTYENEFIGIQFDVNDAISVSYNIDESKKMTRNSIAATAAGSTTTDVIMEQKSIQLAYTTGGATIGVTQVEVDNSDYTDSKKESQTVLSLGISF